MTRHTRGYLTSKIQFSMRFFKTQKQSHEILEGREVV